MPGLLTMLGGPAQASPYGKLLGQNYNADDERAAGFSQAMKNISQSLLNPVRHRGTLGDIGAAASAAGTGYKAGKTSYLKEAEDRELKTRKLEDDNYDRKKRDEQDTALADLVAGLSPEERQLIQANPEAGVALLQKRQFDPDPVIDRTPASIQEYNEAKKQGFKGTILDYQLAKKGNGITITDKDGKTIQIGGAGAGKGKPDTEQTARAKLLSGGVIPSIDNLKTTFDELSKPQNYIGNEFKRVGGRAIMTEEGKQAADSIADVVTTFTYAKSGANARPEEIQQAIDALTPFPNDDRITKQLKWARLKSMQEALERMANSRGDNIPDSAFGVDTGDDTSAGEEEVWDADGKRVK